MSGPLDEQYFAWLYGQVSSVKSRSPSRTFWSIFRQLYKTEFVWIVPNDDNRVEDGRALRREFLNETGNDPDKSWMYLGCSMLEMLIGLSRRLSFDAGGEPRWWFWHMMANIQLDDYSDAVNYDENEVDETLQRVIYRTYGRDGVGGLFPLRQPRENQRRVELWYQYNAYLLEQEF